MDKDTLSSFFAVLLVPCVFALIVIVLIRGCEIRAIQAEAVTRGHAEWYSDFPGYAEKQWRWKEQPAAEVSPSDL